MEDAAMGRDAPDDSGAPDGDGEDLPQEDRKEKMRTYMEFERELHERKSSSSSGGRSGCSGCLIKLAIVSASLTLVTLGLWAWHPWRWDTVTVEASEDATVCPDAESGYRTVRYLTVLGFRVHESPGSEICVGVEATN